MWIHDYKSLKIRRDEQNLIWNKMQFARKFTVGLSSGEYRKHFRVIFCISGQEMEIFDDSGGIGKPWVMKESEH